MKGIEEARMGIIAVLVVMLVSMTKRLPTRKLSSGTTTLALAGIVLLVAAGGASAATPISVCQVIDATTGDGSGEYYLNNSITDSTTYYCIDIKVDNVILDGGGHYIDGVNNISNSCGIRAKQSDEMGDNVTIRNVEVMNFDTGIYVEATGDVGPKSARFTNVLIENCSIHDNGLDATNRKGMGMKLLRVSDSTIRRNEVYNQSGAGVACESGGDGIFLKGIPGGYGEAVNNTIKCNNVHHNLKAGIFLKAAPFNNTISYNYCWENGADGHGVDAGGITFRCMMTDNNTIMYNNASNNHCDGIYCRGSYNSIQFNTAVGNGDAGIDIGVTPPGGDGGDGNEVSYNFAPVIQTCGCGAASTCTGNFGVNNSCDTCTECDGCNSIYCNFTCDSPTSVYFDYDDDGNCSKDFADCACPLCASKCACCNPGVFNGSGTGAYSAACPLTTQLTPGTDPNDCDNTIQGEDERPDLVIQDLAVAYLDGGANETHYNVSYKVCNIGGGDSVASVARTTIDGTTQYDENIGVLAASACSGVITVGPLAMSPDSDDIEVCADATNTNSDEISELNNCSDTTLVAKKPDLTITDKYETWEDKSAKTYWINYTVCNIGNATAPASKTRVDVNGVAPDQIGALAPGACTGDIRVAAMQTMTGDEDTIKLRADGDNGGVGRIDEWDETNNNRTNVYELISDVVVAIDPCPVTIGSDPLSDRTTVDITLSNIADYGAGTIHLYFDTTYVDIVSIGKGDSTGLDSNKQTDGHYKISASNANGLDDDVVFANVTFKPMGHTSGCSYLNLVVETLCDRNSTSLDTVVNNCSNFCIEESNIPGVTNPTASPTRILNDNGRARASGTNLSNLSVWVTDDTEVDTVTINLTPILGGAGNDSVLMLLVSGTKQAGTWEVETNATCGINLTHCLAVNATDVYGNSHTANCVTLEVLRRGDIDPVNVTIPQDNKVDIGDYNEIARYTVGLRSPPDEFTAGTVPADSHNGVDMADALYIAMFATFDPYPGYQAP